MIVISNFTSLFDLMEAFPDEQACLDHLRSIRWRDGEFCPYCGGTRIYHFSDRKNFKCGDCRARFSIKVGTIFGDTKLPLRKWYMAIWMITNHPKGIASTTLAKDLKITQKSAWFVLHRLRHAARTKSFNAPLKGTVEADDTYVGGREKNKHANKAIVLGMVERDGELRAGVVHETHGRTTKPIIAANVEAGSTLMTDTHGAFAGLNSLYAHHTVNHQSGEYVRDGHIHTNTIESVWALLKRQIIGIHHFVSPKHLQRYVDEMTWRFNRRDMQAPARMEELFACVEGRLTYKALIQ
jgi:transposase-like protein